MARRRQSSGGAILLIIGTLIAFISQIPAEVWYVIIAIAVVILALKLFASAKPTSESSSGPLGLTAPPTAVKRTGTSGTLAVARQVESPASSDRAVPRPAVGEAAYKARWVPKGEALRISDFEIPDGMLYAGISLKAPNGRQEPALVNPSLKISMTPVDLTERRMPYWPSYSEVTPEARRAYLQWLATGRTDPTADVGYVFLFFYGLERRALIDLQDSPEHPDIGFIAAEVRRLMEIYGRNGSFRNYATNFLAFLSAGRKIDSMSSTPPVMPRSYELPLEYRIALAQFAAMRKPLPSEWALSWALLDPLINCRTPVQRCHEEFRRLFVKEYGNEFGPGIVLPVNKTKLRVSYRPASGGFLGSVISRDMGDLPDIVAVTGPQKKLQAIVDRCTEQLDRYSRYLGRHPERPHSLDRCALLPIDAWSDAAQGAVSALKEALTAADITMTWQELLGRFDQKELISRATAVQLANQLEAVGIGIEPDLIGGGRLPAMDDHVSIFATSPRDGKILDSPSYSAAAVTIEFGAVAAASDGEAHASEVKHLLNAIDGWHDLNDSARQRLRARLHHNLAHPVPITTLRKKVEVLSSESRSMIAKLLIDIVKADGLTEPSEVRFLESAYKLLQLDPKLVYSALHDDNTHMSVGEVKKTGARVALDSQRIEKLQRETNQIAVVLNGVFEDDSTHPNQHVEPEESAGPESDELLLGLDKEHAPFARLLLTRPQWSRSELADAATDMGLMLDGALERVNDAAFDKFGTAIAAGVDPVEVDQGFREQVVA